MQAQIAARPGRVLYLQYTNPAIYPPLEHSSRLLAQRGWQVLVLGTGAPSPMDQLEFPKHPRIRIKRIPYARPGMWQKLQYVLFTIAAVFSAVVWRADWLYVSDFLATIPALLAARLTGARVVYHEHDAPGDATGTGFVRVCLAARKRLAREAEICALPNVERATLFRREVATTAPVLCIPNYPRLDEVQPARTETPPGPLRLYYHGTLGEPLLPPTLIEAMARSSREIRLCIVGYEPFGYQGYVDRLLAMARRLDVADRVEAHPATSRFRLWELLRHQDVGLALMPMASSNINLQHLVGASNKLTDYLVAGLAVLVPDLPAWKTAFVEPGYGVACDTTDPDSIAAAINWLAAHPADVRAMGERGRQRVVAEWHYEREFDGVVHLMELDAHPGRDTSKRNRFAKHVSAPPGP